MNWTELCREMELLGHQHRRKQVKKVYEPEFENLYIL